MKIICPPWLPGQRLGYLLTLNPATFLFSSSYLPCWRDRDQEGGSLLRELCIAHRGSPCGRAIFGYLAGIIFDGLPAPLWEWILFIKPARFMRKFGEEVLSVL